MQSDFSDCTLQYSIFSKGIIAVFSDNNMIKKRYWHYWTGPLKIAGQLKISLWWLYPVRRMIMTDNNGGSLVEYRLAKYFIRRNNWTVFWALKEYLMFDDFSWICQENNHKFLLRRKGYLKSQPVSYLVWSIKQSFRYGIHARESAGNFQNSQQFKWFSLAYSLDRCQFFIGKRQKIFKAIGFFNNLFNQFEYIRTLWPSLDNQGQQFFVRQIINSVLSSFFSWQHNL